MFICNQIIVQKHTVISILHFGVLHNLICQLLCNIGQRKRCHFLGWLICLLNSLSKGVNSLVQWKGNINLKIETKPVDLTPILMTWQLTENIYFLCNAVIQVYNGNFPLEVCDHWSHTTKLVLETVESKFLNLISLKATDTIL